MNEKAVIVLQHHGIKGQKWGVKKGPPYPLSEHPAGKFTGSKDPKSLASWMKNNISYVDYTTLKSPSETIKRGKGSCHDQVLLELEELRSMGYSPKATFLIEYSPKSSQGGTTHSFVTYEQNGKTYWLENAWGGQEGLHEFNTLSEIEKHITKLHKEGKTGDYNQFPNLEFSDFGDHKPGESLQELIDKSLSTEELEDLVHHGIKGQRWGIRRFQNRDGSLKAAGKKRYGADVEKAKENLKSAKERKKEAAKEYNRATAGGMLYNEKATQKLSKASGNVGFAKERLKNEKAKERLNNETKEKSKHRLALEEKYRSQGMTAEEAEIAAYRRARTEKIIAASAGVAITAAAVYVAKNQYDKRVDKIIKAGTTLQNISDNPNKDFSKPFYSSMNKMDQIKYQGLYGKQLGGTQGTDIYRTKLGVKADVKVASEKSAIKALSDLTRDKSYRSDLEKHLSSVAGKFTPSQNEAIAKGLNSLKKGKVDKNVYDALNLTLGIHSLPTSDSINNGFYNKLKSMGYDAIMDSNDRKFSGYKTSKPLIVFNGAKTAVDAVSKLGEDQINKSLKIGTFDIVARAAVPSIAKGAAVVGGLKAASNYSNRAANNRIVREYRKKHPNTELSYDQILENYYNS